MDACGIVVATSEVIKFEKGYGMMIAVCNTCMNCYFYLLVKDVLLKSWNEIYVNHFYSFTHLKFGAVEWLSGGRNNVLLPTSESQFQEIMECDLQKINISSNFLKTVFVPSVTFNSETYSDSKIISYQGIVSKVKSSDLGIYEIDDKIYLYCIHNSFRSLLPIIEEGCEVFISNAHFFTDYKGRKILVCCGLSSVKSLDSDKTIKENANNLLSVNLSDYSLSIFDVMWLEMLFGKLTAKFCPTVISSEFIFDWNNEIINRLLECFCDPFMLSSCSNKKSVGDEFCSNPHSCDVFCPDVLPTGCDILSISSILDEVYNKISWVEHSDSWKTCFVENPMKYILVGMLYLSKDGCWHITDKSCDVPVVFTQSCFQCRSSKKAFCLFGDINFGYLIALQNFDVVYENIRYQNSTYYSYRYLKTSCCYLFPIEVFSKQNDNLYHPIFSNKNALSKSKQHFSVDEITNLLQNVHLNTKNLLTDISNISFYSEDFNNNSSQNVLVLSKIWSMIDQNFVCYQVLVLFLPQEVVVGEYLDKSKSLFEDTFDSYYSDDDYEFAELINKLDCLFLEDKPRLARLHFESAKQCAFMVPGHIYIMTFSENYFKDVDFSILSSNKNCAKPILIKIKPKMKILHHLHCLGNHYPDDYEVLVYKSIKEIIGEKKIQENCLIRAVLKDKLFEESSTSYSSQSDTDENRTFCLILKDCNSKDTIKAYLPFCPRNMYGFLPGIHLQLYGFVCLCSKRGYLYLKPSASFGMQTINSQPFHRLDYSMTLQARELNDAKALEFSSLACAPISAFFKSICFIVNIVSVKLFLICNYCGKEFEKKCSCFSSYSVKLCMSFIIDDGTEQVLVYCNDEIARKILLLHENEFKMLSLFVSERKSLNFHYKMTEDSANSSSLEQDVFSAYCSSKFLCRQVCLKLKKNSDILKTEQKTLCCYGILLINEMELVPELIKTLKNV